MTEDNDTTFKLSPDLYDGVAWLREVTGRPTHGHVIRDSIELAQTIILKMQEHGHRLYTGIDLDSAIQVTIPFLERAAGRFPPRTATTAKPPQASRATSTTARPLGARSGKPMGSSAPRPFGSAKKLAATRAADPPSVPKTTALVTVRTAVLMSLAPGVGGDGKTTGEIISSVKARIPLALSHSITSEISRMKSRRLLKMTPMADGQRYRKYTLTSTGSTELGIQLRLVDRLTAPRPAR
jgi:hypothetical protein